jgi:hypothetical protein
MSLGEGFGASDNIAMTAVAKDHHESKAPQKHTLPLHAYGCNQQPHTPTRKATGSQPQTLQHHVHDSRIM